MTPINSHDITIYSHIIPNNGGAVHWGTILADFIGRYLNKVDSKGRVSVPAAWRPRLTREDFSGIIAQTGIPEKAIEAYPRDYLEIIQKKLDQSDPLLEGTEFESTILFGGTMLPFDKEGRINLPENYKYDAGIETEAVFVGMGRKFRIWDPKSFDQYLRRARSYMDNRRKKAEENVK